MEQYISINHPRFKKVQPSLFRSKVTPDCMSHRCKLIKKDSEEKLEACCSFGADVDLHERDNIMKHKEQIRSLLDDSVKDKDWFRGTPKEDSDFPSGRFDRTTMHKDGCVFLAHDKRGCAIHRASIEGNWDFRGTKPHVCRLFPLSYETDAIVISDDYNDYSCSLDENGPTLYQVARDDLADIFGMELVLVLDEVEKKLISKSLHVLGKNPAPKDNSKEL